MIEAFHSIPRSPFPVEMRMYGGGKGLAAETEAAATRHRQLVAIPLPPSVLFDAVSDFHQSQRNCQHCHQF